ncbi:sel1 repeat family protein [Pseudomonas sp. MAFF212427]|uniref:Sel1 repeat family protein n=1 Tax=Pseudomonas brassicae TaxID=2708063 RepID=A0A6B3NNX6_9PSED|nr:sel1 repeat family protein [Pseudomonas brassicae]NER63819.1 sel1 repeat family protein [Pseudomonas brassicae]
MKSTVLMLLAGVLASALAQAAPSCPSRDFNTFVTAFAEDAELQQAFTAPALIEQGLPAGLQPLSMAQALANGLVRDVVLPDRVYLRDLRGELLKAFIFEQGACWTLARVEDWAPTLAAEPVADGERGQRARLRGNAYERMGLDADGPLDQQLFVAALNSYLDAAAQGSARGAYAAAAISLSGMAPRLTNARLEHLLRTSAATVPEAALLLANFYCDEGDPRPPDNICRHPHNALKALRQAAALGSGAAFNELGSVYARGEIAPAQPARSLACYTAAVAHGAEWADFNARQMIKQGARADEAQPCL